MPRSRIVTAATKHTLPAKRLQVSYAISLQIGCKAVGLPCPTSEYRFAPPRKWRFDFAWPEQKIALEIDGGLWVQGRHSRGSGLLKEHEKMNTAATMGWKVFRATPQNVGNLALYRQIQSGWTTP